MTVTDQIKTLDRKIKQNEAQYDLDIKAAKISALSSNNLDKYEYLTGEDLGLKPSTVEQAKFEYSPLGKFFNKGLKEKEKKKGLLKRLKNTEDKNEEHLKAIKDQKEIQTKINSGNNIKPSLLKSIQSQDVKKERINGIDAQKMFKTLEDMEVSKIDYSKLVYISGDNKYFNFPKYGPLSSFYLSLMIECIGINTGKLGIEEFKNEIKMLKDKKKQKVQKNRSTKKIKKMS